GRGRLASNSKEHIRVIHAVFGIEIVIARADAVCAIFYTGDISIVDNGDVLGLKVFFERLGDVIIESRAELRTTVQDGDLGAKLRKHRGKFHANGTAANNDQRLRGFFQMLRG